MELNNMICYSKQLPKTSNLMISKKFWNKVKIKEFGHIDHVESLIEKGESRIETINNKIQTFGYMTQPCKNKSQVKLLTKPNKQRLNSIKIGKNMVLGASKLQSFKKLARPTPVIKKNINNHAIVENLNTSYFYGSKEATLENSRRALSKAELDVENESFVLPFKHKTEQQFLKTQKNFIRRPSKSSNFLIKSLEKVYKRQLNIKSSADYSEVKLPLNFDNTSECDNDNTINELRAAKSREGNPEMNKSQKKNISRVSFMFLNNENLYKKNRLRNLQSSINEDKSDKTDFCELKLDNCSVLDKDSLQKPMLSTLETDKVALMTVTTQSTISRSNQSHHQLPVVSDSNSTSWLPKYISTKSDERQLRLGLMTSFGETNNSMNKPQKSLSISNSAQQLRCTSKMQKEDISREIINTAKAQIEQNTKQMTKLKNSVFKIESRMDKLKDKKRRGSMNKSKINEMLKDREIQNFDIIQGDIYHKRRIVSINQDNILLLSNAYQKAKLYPGTYDRLKEGYHFRKTELDKFSESMKKRILSIERQYKTLDNVSEEMGRKMIKLNLRETYLDKVVERKKRSIETLNEYYYT